MRPTLSAIVLAIGLLAAVGIAFGADRDPIAWMMPVLVLTALSLVIIRLADGRSEERRLRGVARELGLGHERARTLPPVTPVLAALPDTRSVQTLEGDLEPGGPPVRLAAVRVRGVALLVALTDLDGSPAALADPHAILAATGVTAAAAEPGAATAAWVAEHPLSLGYATGEDALVVFTPVARGQEPPFGILLAATRELRARLVAPG